MSLSVRCTELARKLWPEHNVFVRVREEKEGQGEPEEVKWWTVAEAFQTHDHSSNAPARRHLNRIDVRVPKTGGRVDANGQYSDRGTELALSMLLQKLDDAVNRPAPVSNEEARAEPK